MPKFSANLSMLFQEVDFLERFAKAADNGFSAVEFMFPYDWPAAEVAERLQRHGQRQVLHNLPAGDWGAGERGIACLPGRESEFQDGVGRAIEYAKALHCPQLNCLAGLMPADVPAEKVLETLIVNLRFAAEALAREEIGLLIEPLNNKDIPGFLLTTSAEGCRVIDAVGHDNVKLQYDIYHMQRMEGDLVNTMSALIGRIGHIQLADNPGRHEPGSGEINYDYLFKAIDNLGYQGWIGCEYIPAAGTEAGLGWLDPYR
jgi:hydroxypyruvate isomerase